MKKVCLITLGCPRNTVDSEVMAEIISRGDYIFTAHPEEADVVLINTCCFIKSAEQESLDKILEIAGLKRNGKPEEFIVFGCLVERYKEELKNLISEVDYLYGVEKFSEIASHFKIEGKFGNYKRKFSFFKHFAYIKISEGCDSECSYCIVPKIRGKYRSRYPEDILDEAQKLAESGAKELILIAEDTASYGKDLKNGFDLGYILRGLDKIEEIEWLRIMYIHPARLSEKILDDISSTDKVCRYLDIPLQHISNKILKDMRRKISKVEIINLIEKIKSKMPETALRTTFIVGYPGETEKDFNELYNFVKEAEFDRLGVFKYSKEKGTDAYERKNHIPEKIKDERYHKIMMLQSGISLKKNRKLIGKKLKVLIDSFDFNDDISIGRTEIDAPEIDNSVIIKGKVDPGNLVEAEIKDAKEYDIFGEL
ncbi:MAG: 30S ribosomal protein S12 methylthiotransferase RimO [Candidatus Helarchaeota archaeon]|nr:30S ribosomal protein S12 methylthiotransferase RimO [Candidatus Helarchaeota archaeon]